MVLRAMVVRQTFLLLFKGEQSPGSRRGFFDATIPEERGRQASYPLFIVNVPDPVQPEVVPLSVQVPLTVLWPSVPFICS